MHVERKLTLSLQSFLFWCDLRIPLNHDTLSQELFLPTTATDILQGVLRFVDKVGSESAQTHLYECPVEKYLGVDVECGDCLS